MTCFVLVPGAWHASWCWERVAPILHSQGHTVRKPDLFGTGWDAVAPGYVTLALWADQIAAICRDEPEPVVLVGHSRGGIVISEAAERAAAHIHRLVYLAAFMLPDSESLQSAAKAHMSDEPPVPVPGPLGTTVIPAERVGPVFYTLTEAAWVERAIELVRPEPMAPFATPLALSDERFGRVPRAYIECSEDRAVPPALQRHFQAHLPCERVVTLPCDHSPFYSAPEALAEALLDLSA